MGTLRCRPSKIAALSAFPGDAARALALLRGERAPGAAALLLEQRGARTLGVPISVWNKCAAPRAAGVFFVHLSATDATDPPADSVGFGTYWKEASVFAAPSGSGAARYVVAARVKFRGSGGGVSGEGYALASAVAEATEATDAPAAGADDELTLALSGARLFVMRADAPAPAARAPAPARTLRSGPRCNYAVMNDPELDEAANK